MTRPAVLLAVTLLAACGSEPAANRYVLTLDLAATVARLGADDPSEHDAAVERLAGLGQAAVPLLVTAAGDPRPGVALGAVEALGSIDDPPAAAALAAVARGRGDPDVRANALAALAVGERDGTGTTLEAALADPEPVVHLTAAGLCGSRCTSPAAVERLVALALAEGTVPGEALRARTSVQKLLAGTDTEAAGRTRALVSARAPRRLAAAASVDERTVAGLLALEVGAPGAEAAVAAGVHGSDNIGIRIAALQALGQRGGPGALPAVAGALDDPALRVLAADTLRRLAARGTGEAAALLATRVGPLAATPPPPVRPGS